VHIQTAAGATTIAPHEAPLYFADSGFSPGEGPPILVWIPQESLEAVTQGKASVAIVWAFEFSDGFETRTSSQCIEYTVRKDDPRGPWSVCTDIMKDTSRGVIKLHDRIPPGGIGLSEVKIEQMGGLRAPAEKTNQPQHEQ
jgi:hypothetical protein